MCEYRLSSLHIASLLSLFRPFFYPSLLPSPSLFPFCKAMRSCRRKGYQSSMQRSWSRSRTTGEMLLFRNSLLLNSLYVLLRCHKQWHTLGNDTLFLRRSNLAGRISFFRRDAVQSDSWLYRASRLVTGPYVTLECSINTALVQH